MASKSKDIHQALNDVMKKVGYVQQTGEVKGRAGYKYPTETDLIQAVRKAMIEEGITMFVLSAEILERKEFEARSGRQMTNTLIKRVFRFTHAESGTHIDATAFGEGSDVGDKSCNKAMTGAKKYAIRETLLLETGDDPDEQSSERQERGKKKTQKRKSPNGRNTKKSKSKKKSKAKKDIKKDLLTHALQDFRVPEKASNGKPIPHSGDVLGDVVNDKDMDETNRKSIIKWLAVLCPNRKGEYFEPAEDGSDNKLVNACRLILTEHYKEELPEDVGYLEISKEE